MNRRNFFASTAQVIGETVKESSSFGSSSNTKNTAARLTPTRPSSGLNTYTGTWDYEQAAHLLRRTMFGPTHAEIKKALEDGPSTTIARLLAAPVPALPPINFDELADVFWVNSPKNASYESRANSLKAWWLDLMFFQPVSITEKMSFFLSNHLVTSISAVGDPRMTYEYLQLLRNNSLGNFKDLVLKVSKCGAMLTYLHGNQNKKGSPNEDFARELMELFTLGRVDGAGNPNYTEQDVIEVARALTGWVTIPANTGLPLQSFAGFSSASHDIGSKQLSSYFNYAVIHRVLPTEYEKEMDDVMDVIFARTEVAENICRELYRWFVYYDIDSTTEQNVIIPLAKIFRDSGYELKPVMEKLLNSEHFFDQLSSSAQIKNPIDFIMGTVRSTLDTASRTQLALSASGRYDFALWLSNWSANLQMEILCPPNVAGWKAYYQAPGYYEMWLNTVTLTQREYFVEGYIRGYNKYTAIRLNNNRLIEQPIKLDTRLFFVEMNGSDVIDVNKVVDSLAQILFPRPLTPLQRQRLLEELMGGLSDSEWTKEWALSQLNQNQAMINRINNFLKMAFNMAEFELA